jgi:Zn ribbon nucleic-acid-binding protein
VSQDETLREVFAKHRMCTVLWREYRRKEVVVRTRCVGCGHETEDAQERLDHLVTEIERWVDVKANVRPG